MQHNTEAQRKTDKNALLKFIAGKKKMSESHHQKNDNKEKEAQSRIRRKSECVIGDQVTKLAIRKKSRDRKNKKSEETDPQESKCVSLKDITFENIYKKDLEVHYEHLRNERQALSYEQEEQLDYQTFRMVKQKEKTCLVQLRDKLKSTSTVSTTITNHHKINHPILPPSLLDSKQE